MRAKAPRIAALVPLVFGLASFVFAHDSRAEDGGAPAKDDTRAETHEPKPEVAAQPIPTWGAVEPGKGFLVGRTSYGELSISAYALVRYLNQLPATESYVDHLGNTHPVDTRNDIYSHRVMVFFKGWIGLPKIRYQIILWTVNTTDQKALFGTLGYQFARWLGIYAGLNALPGTRTLTGSHPYWLGHDRVMADEFFRPYFTNGVWAAGEPVPGFWYTLMVGNNLSALGITARQLTRDLATGGTIWTMPTTHEFGPQGAFGDFEMHEKVATRLGVSFTQSREDRFANVATGAPDNTTLRLADSTNLFDLGALAPGVTVDLANYHMIAADLGAKYQGVFVQFEAYSRYLSGFHADGPLPVTSIHDTGFYVQSAFFPWPRKLELYAATSHVFGDTSAGFGRSYEYLGGANVYLAGTRNIRLNAQVIEVVRSPVSSTFGYYVGGQKGTTLSLAASVFF
ncbi:hypothetical protein AKJ09_01547 [Labilithrix luteola]|uniref:Porin n=1 Tax=Labilithrix luteola TaxID=1391654 RepID=A0A0K1PMX7_9BACT|nr:hypothetical protein [Labilithrix luteola]AKU94883.1 hypothetical protein AKJ09_01547 [Labilithrix luteola]